MRIVAIALLLGALAPVTASADRLVDPGGPTFLSVGTEWVTFDGFVYFAANDGVVGTELWRTDGTAAGTTLVKDFFVGAASNNGSPSGFRVAGNRLYFNVGNNDLSEGSLVVYFIEAGGATPQKALLPSNAAANGSLHGVLGSQVFLRQYESGPQSYALYTLGGTGNTFVKLSGGSIGTEEYAIMGGKAYFESATGANSATELWVTDGTAGNTTMLKDILTGPNGSGPRGLVATSDRVYFTADDGTRGRELWVTDGTEPNTTLVYEHHPLSTATSVDAGAVAQGNTLYYVPNDPATGQELWRTQGTAATTAVVKDLTPGSGGTNVRDLFAFKTGVGFGFGSDSFYSDGTAAGTTVLGRVDNDGYGAGKPFVAGSHAYYRGGFSPFGGAVWRTDGTPGGTFALTAGAFDGTASGNPLAGEFSQLGTKVLFTAFYPHPPGDGIPASARRIYVIDTAQPDETRQATVAPSISGTPAVGQKLTGNQGTWTREPNKYVYQWLRNGTPIPNQSGTTTTLQAADSGTRISFRVTASGIGGPNFVTAESAAVTVGGATTGPPTTPPATPPATKRTLTVRRAAKLTGQARVGKTLKLRTPTFAESGVKLTIRWYLNGKLIKKQTKTSLKISNAARGKRITVKITATKTGYTTRTLAAGPTKKVQRRKR